MQSCFDELIRFKRHQVVSELNMNNLDIGTFKIHCINGMDGSVSSMQYDIDNITNQIISNYPLNPDPSSFATLDLSLTSEDKIHFTYRYLDLDESSLRIIKIGGVEELNPMNFTSEITAILNDSGECSKSISSSSSLIKRDSKVPNIPTMIVCQNCDTNFPTKYQYQRHQCEFNAEKVVLKPNADIKDIDKGMRMKFDCPTCGKQFVSQNNLERHQTSHDETNVNVCEHCNKHFVSENRLRIHKENHCKKAGDISKFYRSDVAVWKCLKCNQVFATAPSANDHTELCSEEHLNFETKANNGISQETDELILLNEEIKSLSHVAPEIVSTDLNFKNILNKNVDKVLTELLLQCEYCNRTYAEKKYLLLHQKKHTTENNYECVTCKETFDSYILATKHWLTKCSDEANLFYLPKMTYCEYCDRTFKSHEILYTHKIKKKHYTPKTYVSPANNQLPGQTNKDVEIVVTIEKPGETKNSIVKLIECVLNEMKLPESHLKDKTDVISENPVRESAENVDGTNMSGMDIKTEILSDASSKSDLTNRESIEIDTEKKRRGRKRKWPKQSTKAKRLAATVEQGFKYQCERCNKIWDSVVELETHRDTDHPANFKCEECNQVVHSAKALLIHSRAHQSLKPYVCEICKRCYSQTSHLWQHMRFHQGIKPFACPHEGCEARYTIRPDLKDHIRKVHTRERPFKCSVCDKCFLTGSVYYQHRLIHTNDRRYGCDICQKRFFRADALNNHRRIHTDERPYPCDICGRQFRQKGDRNKHVRTQHPQ